MQGQSIISEQISNNQKKSAQILITVQNPVLNETQPFKFYTYNIVGTDVNGTFQVRRRFSDFDILRKKLVQKWIGIYIPPIPGKRAQNNPLYLLKKFERDQKEERYAYSRMKFLQHFCTAIAVRPYLFYCELFQIFIRGGSNYQLSIQGCLLKQYSFLLNSYETHFAKQINVALQMDLNNLITTNEDHLTVLRRNQKTLEEICDKIQKATESRDQFNSQFNLCMGTVFPEYQQKFLFNHINRNRQKLIVNRNQQFNIKLNEFKAIAKNNPLEYFFQLILYEIRVTKAFIQAIQRRKDAETYNINLKQQIQSQIRQKDRLLKGQFSFRSIFKTGSKQLQLNEINMKIQIHKYQHSSLQKMIRIMLISLNYEMDEFRLRRGKEYALILRSVAQKELIQLNSYEQLLIVALSALNN